MPKVFVIGGSHGWYEFFKSNQFEVVQNPFEADLFQFTGGEDVSPELYNCLNIKSYNNLKRDMFEMGYFALAQRLGKPCVGICRGGQFLNVMCGGAMIQDVKGHTNDHEIECLIDDDGNIRSMMATSTHHQMMKPKDRAIILAWASIVGEYDPEVVYYRDNKCLCFQPHPEYGRYPELTKHYFELINELLLGK